MATVSTWDLMDSELKSRSVSDMVRPAHYVTHYETIDDLLPVLKAREDHMAIVVDEFGSAVGIITMEDVIEEVVGDIDVGYEFEEFVPRKRRRCQVLDEDAQSYEMDARLPVSEVNDVLGLNLPTAEFHTIAGLLMARLRRMPHEGEFIIESGFRFTVSEGTDRAVKSVTVERETSAVANKPGGDRKHSDKEHRS